MDRINEQQHHSQETKETKELLDSPEDKIPQEALLLLIKSTREMITYLYNKHGSKRCYYPTEALQEVLPLLVSR